MEGITDRNAAEELKGLELGIARTTLGDAGDEDDFFLVDLIGLSVQDEAGQPLGTVKWVHDFGAGDVLELQLAAQKKTEMTPFSIEAVPEVNVKEGYLVVRPSAWQVPDEEKEGEGE
jgi:16S rRNA processing protein RimM